MKIDIPKMITARQEELLREFDAESSEKSSRGILGSVADAAEGKEDGCKDEDSHDKEKKAQWRKQNQFCRNIGVSTTLINKQQVYEGIKRKLRVYSDTHYLRVRHEKESLEPLWNKEVECTVLVDRK